MQLYEEFESFCNRLDKDLEEEIERQIRFITNLTNALIELSIQNTSGIKKYKHLFIREISNDAHKYAVDINETLDYFLYNDSEDDILTLKQTKIPKWNVTEEEKQSLEAKLKTLSPYEFNDFVTHESNKIKLQAEKTKLMTQCYQKVKEIIWHHYPEILDFSSHTIRYIDSMAYITMTEYVEGFYYLIAPLLKVLRQP